MSGINRYLDHALILPEDDANRQIANGFLLEANSRKIQILPEVGGWKHVGHTFLTHHVTDMRKFYRRHFIFLLESV
jgi:hypothetical protein